MEDILASIRKILADETVEEQNDNSIESNSADLPSVSVPAIDSTEKDKLANNSNDDVFNLSSTEEVSKDSQSDSNMAEAAEVDKHSINKTILDSPVSEEIIPPTEPLVGSSVATASACTLTYLAQMVAEEKKASLGNAGITIEEIVKEVIRPIIKEWLNQNLYEIVEKLVRKEIEKVIEKVEI